MGKGSCFLEHDLGAQAVQCGRHAGQGGCSHQSCWGGRGPGAHTPWTCVFALKDTWLRVGWGHGERDGAEPLEKPTVRHRKDPDSPQVPTPTPSATNWAAVSAFSLSPLLSFQSFRLFTYFGLTQPQWISLPCDQTIHHEDKWAKSQSSGKQSSYQKGSILQGLQVAVKFCILCSLPKCFLFNTSVFQ